MNESPATVVTVHGLYMTGHDMFVLRMRLRKAGFATAHFSYRTVKRNIEANAAELNAFLRRLDAPVVHLLGHSLGGLVIRRMLADFPEQRPGRVVTLGTPHNGSLIARYLQAAATGRWLLGRSGEGALLGGLPPWPVGRELGVIAGTVSVGASLLIPGMTRVLPRPNDGTVAVAETRLAGLTDHICLPLSHSALLFSRLAADQVVAFLREGRFRRA